MNALNLFGYTKNKACSQMQYYCRSWARGGKRVDKESEIESSRLHLRQQAVHLYSRAARATKQFDGG